MLQRYSICIAMTVMLFFAAAVAYAGTCEEWPEWDGFRQKFLSDDGRVVDRSIPQMVTTSEGQSYALLFALIAHDRASFDRILHWTENNLASGDLTAQLPAWQWGQRADGNWNVIDGNTASDADLWLAYTLGEAGRLWNDPRYAALAELLADRIIREETAELPGLGLALLPGKQGFHADDNTWRLNPSYFPMQVLHRFAVLYPQSRWSELERSSLEIIMRSAPTGFVPEWVDYQSGKGFITDHVANASGVGFNAIRVYLWAGMLDARDKVRAPLLKQLAPMAKFASGDGALMHEVRTADGVQKEPASAGFSSALLPFLKSLKMNRALHLQQQRVVALAPMDRTDNYYDQVLTLFGKGWLDGYYRFERDGRLIPRWKCAR